MQINRLTLEDIHKFAPFYQAYFNAEGDRWTENLAYKRLHQMWSIDDSLCFKAEEQGFIYGILMGFLECFDDGPCFHIFEILVLREHQNAGIGTALIQTAEAEAKRLGAVVSTLEALTDLKHEIFYGRMGYQTKPDFAFKVKRL